jgi:GNAT superfamily N-acetyltransferase
VAGVIVVDDTAAWSALYPEANALLNRTQGEGLFAADYLEQCARDPDTVIVLALDDARRLEGVATARVLPADGFDYYLGFGDTLVRDLFARHRVGSMETASVIESRQGRGLGQQLARPRIEWLAARGCTAAIGVSWRSGLAHTSDRVFERVGFTRAADAPAFYVDDSLARGYVCPVCGQPPCRCAATFYVKYL